MANCENCKNSYVGLDGDLSCNSFFQCVNGSIYQPIDNSKLKHFIDNTTTDKTGLKEMVNHPNHYNMGKYEAIDVIEDWNLGFNLGNTVKYISRAGHKDDIIQDLKKAKWYFDREIQRLENK